MDAVRTAVERVGGRVSIESRAGLGATVRFSLPFSVMMTQVMTVEASGQMFGVPLDAIVETVSVPKTAIAGIGAAHAIVLRNRTIPVVDLANVLGSAKRRAVRPTRPSSSRPSAGQFGGLEVDRIGQRLEVILKPLDGLLVRHAWNHRHHTAGRRPCSSGARYRGAAAMTIKVSAAGQIELEGTCSSDDAELLMQHLLATPNMTVDWRGCEAAHTAVVQVLMAARPKLLGPPATALLEKWVQPLLAATCANDAKSTDRRRQQARPDGGDQGAQLVAAGLDADGSIECG